MTYLKTPAGRGSASGLNDFNKHNVIHGLSISIPTLALTWFCKEKKPSQKGKPLSLSLFDRELWDLFLETNKHMCAREKTLLREVSAMYKQDLMLNNATGLTVEKSS